MEWLDESQRWLGGPMKFFAFSTLLVAACASGSTAIDVVPQGPTGEPVSRVGARLDLSTARSAELKIVSPIDPELPTADRISASIRHVLGDEASVQVEMCVSPAGHVVTARLLEGSTLKVFDKAVMRDVMAWQFEQMPGPANVKSCQRRTITYKPHS